MGEALSTGGYNAMCGHGGTAAYVEDVGKIFVGDSVVPEGYAAK